MSENISIQSTTTQGSNGNTTWFSTGTTSTGSQYFTQYMNSGNDSAVIGNYLHGYYYDTQYGFFKLDWSATDPLMNVRVIASTDRCASGYGYKLSGFAQGIDAGLLNFNYSSDVFVYYCESDGKLHGYAYDVDFGFQSFEGVRFNINAIPENTQAFTAVADPFFVNNNSIILSSPVGAGTIQGDQQSTDWGKSMLFYIVK